MSFFSSSHFILLILVWLPSAAATNSVHGCCIHRKIFICSLLTVFTKKCMHMQTHLEFIHVVTEMFVHIMVILKQRFMVSRIAANNCEYHRQSIFTGTQNTFRCATHCDPNIQVIVYSAGQH